MDDGTADPLTVGQAGPATVRGGALRLGSFVVSAGLGAIGSAIILRHLGVRDSGQYMSIMALVTVVGGISDLGVTQLGIRELALTAEQDRSLLARELLALRYLLTVSGLALMLVIALALYRLPIVAGVVIAGCGLLVQVTADNFGVLLQVQLRMGWVAAAETLRAFGACAVSAILALLGGRVVAFSCVSVAGSVASLAVMAAVVGRHHTPLPRFQLARLRQMLRQVAPYALAMVAIALYPRAGIVALHLFSSGRQVGLYGASTRVIDGLGAIPILLMTTVLPVMFRAAYEDLERFRYALSRVLGVAAVLGMGAAVALAVGARIPVAVIGGSNFDAAARALALQSIGYGLGFVAALWANVLLTQRRHRALVSQTCFALVVLLVALVVLTPSYGARGAALAMAIAEGASVLVGGILVYRDKRLGMPDFLMVAKVLLCGAVAVGLSMLVHGDVLRLAVAVVAYGLTVLLTGALPAEVWSGLSSWRVVHR